MLSQPEPARTPGAPDKAWRSTSAHTIAGKRAGPNAAKLELLLSENGQFGTFPEFALHFACSHRQAIMNALGRSARSSSGKSPPPIGRHSA